MKKFLCLCAMGMSLVACGQRGYVLTGTVEGANEGDTIYLSSVENGKFINQDSTTIRKGIFTFKGKQDSVVNMYIRTKSKVGNTNRKLFTDFFLENGQIEVHMTEMGGTTSGTPNNDIYQAGRDEMYARQQDLMKLPKEEQMKAFDEAFSGVLKEYAAKYIDMPAGILFLKQAHHFMGTTELDTLLCKIPEKWAADPAIVRMKEQVKNKKKSEVGQPFVDFSMQDIQGNSVKLSDYAGKGKVLLIDFWASWCGPCCRAIPGLIELYNQYKDKGFEVVGVSFDQDVEAWKKAVERLKIPWKHMSDLKGWKCEAGKLYAVGTIPYTVLIDAEGQIIAHNMHQDELKDVLEKLLNR